jgi:predicted HicB family RNase H-like nuclease
MTDGILLRIPKELHYQLMLESARRRIYIYKLIDQMLKIKIQKGEKMMVLPA